MTAPPTIRPHDPERNAARTKLIMKALRYAGVSFVAVLVAQGLIFLFHGVLDFDAKMANGLAVAISSVPAYLLNRSWVWGKRGRNHFTREVLPFWGFAFAGLILSTLFVDMVEERTDATLAVSGASLAGFGVLWVARFFVLDRILFKDVAAESPLVHLAEDAPLA
ncbi:MAG: GtrA family protein [Acidimicrobiales bacterium]